MDQVPVYAVRNGEWDGDCIAHAGSRTAALRSAIFIIGQDSFLRLSMEKEPSGAPCWVARYRSNLPAHR